MLIDLPAIGEAGRHLGHRFLRDLKNNIDVLLQVKRPGPNESVFSDADSDALDLADEVRMGVEWHDFVSIIINTDPSYLESADVQNSVEHALKIAKRNGLLLLVGDVADLLDVRDQILGPVLRSLADRLAAMDHRAATVVLPRASDVATRAEDLADRLVRQVEQWRVCVSDEGQVLRTRSRELRHKIARALNDLRREYGQQAEDRQVIREFEEGIARAKQRLIAWAEAGFGWGDYGQWLAVVEPAMAVHAVDQIEERMHAEAGGLAEVLAWMADQFFDQFGHNPGIEDEFAMLCAPVAGSCGTWSVWDIDAS